MITADDVELRVLGCLVEKQRTTPDQYPLSLNALRLACNQTTNRDPVVSYDEPTIREALLRMSDRDWVRLASGPGSRAVKYRHLLDDVLGTSPSELALLAVLMLRGPQTPGELKQRTERLYSFPSLADVETTLERLIGRELVGRVPRRPGQKEERYQHRLGSDTGPLPEPAEAAPPRAETSVADRVAALEARVARLEEALGTSAFVAEDGLVGMRSEERDRSAEENDQEPVERDGFGDRRALVGEDQPTEEDEQ